MSTIDSSGADKFPAITVITVVLNGRNDIARTIDSVLAQDYPSLEYIVIDGKSTDGTQDIIEKYRDRLDRFVSERDDGIYDAMNKAVGLASGDFILMMNAGDVLARRDAISSAMAFVRPEEGDQIIFGRWIRKRGERQVQCRPILERGIFNHQAVIYSRNIHSWHGGYVSIKGLSAADYLFFSTLFSSARVKNRVIDTELAIIDIDGISAGLQTYSQKTAIDYICGRATKMRLLLVLAAHPIYHRLKTFLGLRR